MDEKSDTNQIQIQVLRGLGNRSLLGTLICNCTFDQQTIPALDKILF